FYYTITRPDVDRGVPARAKQGIGAPPTLHPPPPDGSECRPTNNHTWFSPPLKVALSVPPPSWEVGGGGILLSHKCPLQHAQIRRPSLSSTRQISRLGHRPPWRLGSSTAA